MRASVVMAAYNAAWCIDAALDSVLAQTRPPHEVLVCDDGSTDGTPDRVEARYGGRVTVLRLPHVNAAATRCVGLARAGGDWLAFLDADDVWHPEKLERQQAFLAAHPEVRWQGTDGRLVSAEGVVRESWFSDYFDDSADRVGDLQIPLVHRCFPLVSSMLVERVAYDAVGGLDPAIALSYDYDLWLRLAGRYPGGMMADRLVDYFTGPATLSRNYEARYRDDLAIMRRAERGDYGDRPGLRRIASGRAATLEFKLALLGLRDGRFADARERLRRAARRGPLRRRLMAAGGAWLPDAALARLARAPWAKRAIASARANPARLSTGIRP
jgi:glycosyltransferase involved in cell wall biosynthesis